MAKISAELPKLSQKNGYPFFDHPVNHVKAKVMFKTLYLYVGLKCAQYTFVQKTIKISRIENFI